jgi:hypothetical protein
MANVFKTVNGKILLTAPGSGKIANECCCGEGDCRICGQGFKEFTWCISVTDGGTTPDCYGIAYVRVDTDGCAYYLDGGAAVPALYGKDTGTLLGYFNLDIVFEKDFVYVRIWVWGSPPYFPGGGKYSPWVKVPLIGCAITLPPMTILDNSYPITMTFEPYPCYSPVCHDTYGDCHKVPPPMANCHSAGWLYGQHLTGVFTTTNPGNCGGMVSVPWSDFNGVYDLAPTGYCVWSGAGGKDNSKIMILSCNYSENYWQVEMDYPTGCLCSSGPGDLGLMCPSGSLRLTGSTPVYRAWSDPKELIGYCTIS